MEGRCRKAPKMLALFAFDMEPLKRQWAKPAVMRRWRQTGCSGPESGSIPGSGAGMSGSVGSTLGDYAIS